MTKCKVGNKLRLGIERVNICRHFGNGKCKDEDAIMINHGARFLDRGVHRKAYSFNTLKNPKCVDFGGSFCHDDFNKYGDFITQPKMDTLVYSNLDEFYSWL